MYTCTVPLLSTTFVHHGVRFPTLEVGDLAGDLAAGQVQMRSGCQVEVLQAAGAQQPLGQLVLQ